MRFTPSLPFVSLDRFLEQRTHGFLVAVLLGLVALIYVNSLDATWIFDDLPNIVNNPRLHLNRLDWASISGTFIGTRDYINRPLAYLSFGLDHYLHGLDVLGYHLVNLAIHALTALTLYLLVLRLLRLPILAGRYSERAKTIAFLTVLLWATSPIQVTAVTVIVQRMASLAALFFILSMLCYLIGRAAADRPRQIVWLGLCVLAGLLSLASKENAAMLPLVLYLLEVLLIRGVDRAALQRQLKLAAIPLTVLAVITLVLIDPTKISASYDQRPFTMLERLLTEPRILIFYLSQMLYPDPGRFTLIHDVTLSTSLWSPWTTLPAILFWLAWIGTGLALARRRPLIAFALLFYPINHLIESSVLALELVYEHRNYLPSMSLYLLAALGILTLAQALADRPRVQGAMALGLTAFVGFQCYAVMERNAIFAHPLLVWTDNLAKAPHQSRVHTNLGQVYSLMGLPKKARAEYQAALEAGNYQRETLRAVPLGNLGNSYLRNGNLAKAREYYAQAVAIDPGAPKPRIGLVIALMGLGEFAAARPVLEEGMKRLPESANLLSLYAALRFKQGDYQAAIDAATRSIALDPEPDVAHRVLGESHARLGDYATAERFWRVLVEARPNDVEANLALLRLADLRHDETTLRATARHLQELKKDKSWEALLGRLDRAQKGHALVFLTDPKGLLPLIERGLAEQAG